MGGRGGGAGVKEAAGSAWRRRVRPETAGPPGTRGSAPGRAGSYRPVFGPYRAVFAVFAPYRPVFGPYRAVFAVLAVGV